MIQFLRNWRFELGSLVATVFLLAVYISWVIAQTAMPNDGIAWDYFQTWLSEFQINRFETCFDGVDCADVSPDNSFTDENTCTTCLSFLRRVPTLQIGDHVFEVRACNAVGCSETALFVFTLEKKPQPPKNPRWKGGQK